MNDSPLDKLIPALIKAQEEIRPIQPNAVNPFLKNSYADLGAHIQGILPALHKNGLAISQLVFSTQGEVGVETILLHSSGQSLSSKVSMPVADEKGKSSAQVAGSVISYLRRYALAAIVGAYSGDDDDGAAAQKGKKASQPPTATGDYREHAQTAPKAASRPLAPEVLKDMLNKKAAQHAGATVPPERRGKVMDILATIFDGNRESASSVFVWLFDAQGTNDNGRIQALWDWLAPNDELIPSTHAMMEAKAVMATLLKP